MLLLAARIATVALASTGDADPCSGKAVGAPKLACEAAHLLYVLRPSHTRSTEYSFRNPSPTIELYFMQGRSCRPSLAPLDRIRMLTYSLVPWCIGTKTGCSRSSANGRTLNSGEVATRCRLSPTVRAYLHQLVGVVIRDTCNSLFTRSLRCTRQIRSEAERVIWNLSSVISFACVAQLRSSCLASDPMTTCSGGRSLTVRACVRASY